MTHRFTYIILLFVLISFGCESVNDPVTDTEAEKIEVAKNKFKEGNQKARELKNWEALGIYQEAERLYSNTTHPKTYWAKYLLKRQKSNVLNELNLSGIAAETMYEALEYLDLANDAGREMDYEKEYYSSLRYQGSYYRNNLEYDKSNKILLPLLNKDIESIKDLRAQIKNRIGRNYYDLFKYQKAYDEFDDILKNNTSISLKMKAHYLQNRAQAAYKLSKKNQAFADMSQAVAINQSLDDRNLYVFTTLMDLGEFYLWEYDFELAKDQFDKALKTLPNIDQDEDLFKIYDLQAQATGALKLESSLEYRSLYDSLDFVFRNNQEQYTASQQYARLEAGLAKVGFDLIRKQDNNRKLMTSALVCAFVITLTILSFSLSKVLRRRQQKRNKIKALISRA